MLAGDVADAKDERGEKRARDARSAADRHHDQKVDHEFEREGRIEPQNFGAERAAEAGKARPKGEGKGENPIDIDAQPARHAAIVDRGAQATAKARVGKDELQRDRQQPANDDDQQTIAADTYAG